MWSWLIKFLKSRLVTAATNTLDLLPGVIQSTYTGKKTVVFPVVRLVRIALCIGLLILFSDTSLLSCLNVTSRRKLQAWEKKMDFLHYGLWNMCGLSRLFYHFYRKEGIYKRKKGKLMVHALPLISSRLLLPLKDDSSATTQRNPLATMNMLYKQLLHRSANVT